MNWLSFKLQDNGQYVFEDESIKITYTNTGTLSCFKNNVLVFEKDCRSVGKAILNAEKIYTKFK